MQKLSPSEFRAEINEYLLKLAQADCCVSVRGEAMKCTCLAFLADRHCVRGAVADALQLYFDSNESSKRLSLVRDYRQAFHLNEAKPHDKQSGPPRNYPLPLFVDKFTGNEDDAFTEDIAEAMRYGVCQATWTSLFNLKRTAFEGVKDLFDGKRCMVHGNKGKHHNNPKIDEAYRIIHERLHFEQENNATPFATRIVRDTAGCSSLRDDNEFVFLPPSFSKRQCYYEICFACGYRVTFKDRGKSILDPKEQWPLRDGFFRTQEEANDHENGRVVRPVVSWRSFGRYWQKNFPKLRVRAKGEDTCTDCYLLHQRLIRLGKKKDEMMSRLNAEELAEIDGVEPEVLAEAIDGYEETIQECKKHVKMHEAQRKQYNRYRDESKHDLFMDLPLHLLTLLLVIDMAQNGATPYLAGDQMGDFYYMSPLTHYIFGVADPASEKMNAYIWEEACADRGADNIVSCVHRDLVRRGIIGNIGRAIKHLVLAADNCPAQNKNKAMLKYCMWLVEVGYAEKVTLLFLVKGHTKNDCDRFFNLLKQGTVGEDIWTDQELDRAYTKINGADLDLTRLDAGSNHWRGWSQGLNDYYRDPESGTILSNHEFIFGDSDKPTKYKRREYHDAESIEYDLMPTARSAKLCVGLSPVERKLDLVNLPNDLDILPPPGLSAIKANECQTNSRRSHPITQSPTIGG